MLTLTGRNVNALWPQGLMLLEQMGQDCDSRAGRVRVAPCPVVSVYERPQERVLMDPVRDANPFFHLMESLWMLAGRDDAAFLNRYVSDFGKRFAEDELYIHGAYGSRWRDAFGYDQLNVVVEKLRTNPDDRQAVIQMWDALPYDAGHDDLRGTFKDRPCNTHVYLRVRNVAYRDPPVTDENSAEWEARISRGMDRVLDLTVLCRSNDVVWGAYGANAVHFSVLQEYLAGRIGVGIGKMYQFSNNYHGYVDVTQKFGDPMLLHLARDPYASGEAVALPMGREWGQWDADLAQFMAWHDEGLWGGGKVYLMQRDGEFVNSWFAHTAVPMAEANWYWKQKYHAAALGRANMIDALDWRHACLAWMKRRTEK